MTRNFRAAGFVDLDSAPFRKSICDALNEPNDDTKTVVSAGSVAVEDIRQILDRVCKALDQPVTRGSDFEESI